MISHSDRALAWFGRNDPFAADELADFKVACVRDLTVEFERLLPGGSVAVDRERLRDLILAALKLAHNDGLPPDEDRDRVFDAVHAIMSHCPLGGDDVEI